jgi:hypothetical protein
MAYSTSSSLLPADGDDLFDVYSWNRGVFALASGGPGSHSHGASRRFISDDGTRVLFSTYDALTAGDTDTAMDVYETAGGTTTLVSTGPTDTGEQVEADFAGASEDGTRVFFETKARLVAADTDPGEHSGFDSVGLDIYMRSGGVTTLVSEGGSGFHRLVGVSRNGDRVVEYTSEALTSDDTDSEMDVYERFGGTTKLISKGLVADSTPDSVEAVDITPDAKSVVVKTLARLTEGDQNEDFDLYQFSRGRTTLVTSNSDGISPRCTEVPVPSRRPPCDPIVSGQTDDGSKVLFMSTKAIGDSPGPLGVPVTVPASGLLEKSKDGRTRLIDDRPLMATHYIADDGSRYVFQTSAKRSPDDTDEDQDLYKLENGSATLLSGGGAADGTTQQPVAVSPDARRIFFRTTQRLVPQDTDNDEDDYVNTDAGPRLAATGPADTRSGGFAGVIGASASGDRWFISASRPLVATDTDASHDLYIRHLDGTTRLLTP